MQECLEGIWLCFEVFWERESKKERETKSGKTHGAFPWIPANIATSKGEERGIRT